MDLNVAFQTNSEHFFNRWFLYIWLDSFTFKADRIFLESEMYELKDLGKIDLG